MRKILVSACLIGERVRYDGGDCRQGGIIQVWLDQGRLIALCPEVAGGLPVPRPPAEVAADGGRVLRRDGEDVTAFFSAGAEEALALCREHDIGMAVLKEGSPSCGSHLVNDGSFAGVKVAGEGVTAALLRRHGIRVFSEHQLAEAEQFLRRLS